MAPCTNQRGYGFSYSPSGGGRSAVPQYKAITLSTAIDMVMRDEISSMVLFDQMPMKIKELLNDSCQKFFEKEFRNLTNEEQKSILAVFLIAADNAPGQQIDNKCGAPLSANCHKKWWQFWR